MNRAAKSARCARSASSPAFGHVVFLLAFSLVAGVRTTLPRAARETPEGVPLARAGPSGMESAAAPTTTSRVTLKTKYADKDEAKALGVRDDDLPSPPKRRREHTHARARSLVALLQEAVEGCAQRATKIRTIAGAVGSCQEDLVRPHRTRRDHQPRGFREMAPGPSPPSSRLKSPRTQLPRSKPQRHSRRARWPPPRSSAYSKPPSPFGLSITPSRFNPPPSLQSPLFVCNIPLRGYYI